MGHEWRCMDPIENGDIPASYGFSLLYRGYTVYEKPWNSRQNLLELKNDPHVCEGKKTFLLMFFLQAQNGLYVYIASKFYLRGCLVGANAKKTNGWKLNKNLGSLSTLPKALNSLASEK